ncbi:dehydrogenase e1 component domain-containing protein [Ditylenchus destructor]|uniref:pyruvate dehydrogenase (acetyl-transferring) n=1 Tax=Ditylenchus destructor TaxID=166010 RepID=A0AAD4R0H1_9BILA|nr:dehydrogenase e1 component domain-containing protein [Ditylenchus destructor]
MSQTKNEATFNTHAYKVHKLEDFPAAEAVVTREEALRYYTQMKTARTMEGEIDKLYREKRARGFCHEYSGQEACATGIVAVKDENDAVITSYRCHPWAYLMGSSVPQILCELTGHIQGVVHGKGGSMHMFDPHFYGGNGIVGAQESLGVGIAMAFKYREEQNVSFTLFGDGAANQGQLYEVANMAELWKLPVVFVCENNGYAMFTSVEHHSSTRQFYNRFSFLPGLWVDGMDLISVREAMRFARQHALSGKGPIFVELATYRYMGHTASDPGIRYRPLHEVDEVRRAKDPISHFREKILGSNLVTPEELTKIDEEIVAEIAKAGKISREYDPLPKEALYADVYKNTEPQLVRGATIDESVKQPCLYTKDILEKIGHVKLES